MGNFIVLMIGIAVIGIGALVYFKYKDKHS